MTAKDQEDYVASNGTISFNQNQTIKTIEIFTIPPNGDSSNNEISEFFKVELFNGQSSEGNVVIEEGESILNVIIFEKE